MISCKKKKTQKNYMQFESKFGKFHIKNVNLMLQILEQTNCFYVLRAIKITIKMRQDIKNAHFLQT